MRRLLYLAKVLSSMITCHFSGMDLKDFLHVQFKMRSLSTHMSTKLRQMERTLLLENIPGTAPPLNWPNLK